MDQRLVRDGHMGRVSVEALSLYLFLLAVGDAKGLSYYGDASVGRSLPFDQEALIEARRELIREGLIAFEKPFYQVLSLENGSKGEGDVLRRCGGSGSSEPTVMREVLRRALEEKK